MQVAAEPADSGSRSASSINPRGEDGGGDVSAAVPSDSDDDEINSVFAELEAQRAQWGNQEEESEEDWFRIALIGGKWSMSRAGRAAYGFRADVRARSQAAAFCESFHLPKSATFDNEVYGEVVGSSLARLWVARMCALTRDWCQQGCPPVLERSSLSEFSVPQALEAALQHLKGKSAKRMTAILEITP